MNTSERAYLSRVAALGCLACRIRGLGITPPEIHHRRDMTGVGRREDHSQAIPLCPPHHRLADGSARFAGEIGYHVAPLQFEERYGTQKMMVERTQREAECDLVMVH